MPATTTAITSWRVHRGRTCAFTPTTWANRPEADPYRGPRQRAALHPETGTRMPLFTTLLAMPDQFERLLAQVPTDRLDWEPANWAGIPPSVSVPGAPLPPAGHRGAGLSGAVSSHPGGEPAGARLPRWLSARWRWTMITPAGYRHAARPVSHRPPADRRMAEDGTVRRLAAPRPLWRLWGGDSGRSGAPARQP